MILFSKSIAVVKKHRLPIISNETYAEMVFRGKTFHSLASVSHEVPILVCSSMSKRYLVPGWRVGWILIHDPVGAFKKEVYNLAIVLLFSKRVLFFEKCIPSTQQFSLEANFCGQATSMKIKPMKNCTDERLATLITVGYPQPPKIIPPKILSAKYYDRKNFCVYNAWNKVHIFVKGKLISMTLTHL